MIELVLLAAVGAGALAAGATAAIRRARRGRGVAERAPLDPLASDVWIDVGDALVLDHGRGATLSITRRWDLIEAGDAPYLVLLEADGAAADRALLAYDPLTSAKVAILRAAGASALEALAPYARRAGVRPPDRLALDAPLLGCTVRLEWRRPASPRLATAEGASQEGALPPVDEQSAWQIARWADALGHVALAVRTGDGALRVFAGQDHPADAIDVLRNRTA